MPVPDPPPRRVLRVVVVLRLALPDGDRRVMVEPEARVRRVAGFAAADFAVWDFGAAGLAAADFGAAGLAAADFAAAGLAAEDFAAAGFPAARLAVAGLGVLDAVADECDRVVLTRRFGGVTSVAAAGTVAASGAERRAAGRPSSAARRDRRSRTSATASATCFRRFASTSSAFWSRFSSFAFPLAAPPLLSADPADWPFPDVAPRSSP